MSKYGVAKFINHERVWRAAMTIEYLAQEETGTVRAPGGDLLIEIINARGQQLTQSIGYIALGNRTYHNTWPVLTTMQPATGVSRDIMTLVEGDATHEIFYSDCRRSDYGAGVVQAYANRMKALEDALRDPSIQHYVEFERPPAIW